MTPRPTLYILDAYSLIYQVFHAIPLMTGPAGQPTNAVFGIFRDLLNLLKARKPDYLAAAFDGGGQDQAGRVDFPEYKAQRGPMPEDMVPQIPVIRRALRGVPRPRPDPPRGRGRRRHRHPGPAGRRAGARRRHLHGRQGRPPAPRRPHPDPQPPQGGVPRRRGAQGRLGRPARPGRRHPGPDRRRRRQRPRRPRDRPQDGRRRCSRSSRPSTDLMANLDKVSGAKRKQNLKDHAETVKQGRELITLDDDLPLELDWDALKSDGYDAKALKALCQECGFHRFLEEIVDTEKRRRGPLGRRLPAGRHPREARASSPPSLARQPRFCLDTETTALDPLRANLGRLLVRLGAGGRLLPARPGADGVEGPAAGRRPRRDPPGPDQPRGREGRPEPQVRHAGPPGGSGCRSSGRSPTRWS